MQLSRMLFSCLLGILLVHRIIFPKIMKVLDFSYGRIVFSRETLDMQPSLPEKVPARAQYYHFQNDVGFLESGFFDFEALKKDLERKEFVWLHLSGSVSDEFFDHLKQFADFSDERNEDA